MGKTLRILLLTALVSFNAWGADAPFFNASLTPDVAIHPKTQRINGITLSVWGENEQHSFAFGFLNGLKGHSVGFSWGLFVNYGDSYTGAQLAFVNWLKKDFVGLQVGLVNIVNGTVKGMQYGAVNYATKVSGLQLGFVNYAESVDSGVQVGLVNIIVQNKVWFKDFPHAVAPAMILVNWRFH